VAATSGDPIADSGHSHLVHGGHAPQAAGPTMGDAAAPTIDGAAAPIGSSHMDNRPHSQRPYTTVPAVVRCRETIANTVGSSKAHSGHGDCPNFEVRFIWKVSAKKRTITTKVFA
jgi:hypothetical protein